MRMLKEAILSLFKKPITVKYPKVPSPCPEGYRGRPIFDKDKCTGCGACASICPADAITILDNKDRVLSIWLSKCTFCGKCSDICPEKAIKLTQEFELETSDKSIVKEEIKITLVRCKICGGVIGPQPQIAKMAEELRKANLSEEEIDLASTTCNSCKIRNQSSKMFPIR